MGIIIFESDPVQKRLLSEKIAEFFKINILRNLKLTDQSSVTMLPILYQSLFEKK